MKVAEFINLEKSGAMYRVVNASLNGYMTSQKVLIEADRNVVKPRYGESELVGFQNVSKNVIALYVKVESHEEVTHK